MTSKRAALTMILISIVAAAAILISSALLKGSDESQTVMFVIIAIWAVPFFWLSGRVSSKKQGANKEDTDA